MRSSSALLTSVALAAVTIASAAAAQDTRSIVIEAQDLGEALRAFSRASGRDVIADAALVAGRRSAPVRGASAPEAALAQMLQSSGLRAELVDGTFVIRAPEASGSSGRSADIVVVGTRIRGAGPVGAPVSVLDRFAIDRSGRGTVQGLLETVPGNFGGGQNEAVSGTTARNNAGGNSTLGSSINLRGLGANSTLVLFDNVRPANAGPGGTFADVSLIPVTAIDRIEILTDGASAVYGSDAVAGVVNFRFRNRFDGLETSARFATAKGDAQEYQLGAIGGTGWGSGHAVLAYQYYRRSALSGADRAVSTEDLRPLGGPDYRSEFAAPGTIVAADGSRFGIPPGQDGRDLDPADLQPGVTNRRDARKSIDLLPSQEAHSVYASAEQELTTGLSAYARLLYARRTFSTVRTSFLPASPVSVPTTNAFYVDPIGTGQPVTVFYDFAADLGPQRQSGSVDGLSAVAGSTLALGPWQIDLSGAYGFQIEHFRVDNIPNRTRLAEALASSDRQASFNVFGSGGGTSGAVIDRVRGSAEQRSRYEVWTAALRGDGPLFALPSGLVRLAAGVEHRSERLGYRGSQDITGPGPIDNPFPGLPADRKVDAVYAELLVPLAGGDWNWLPGQLDLSVAARKEWYSDVANPFNPKFGLSWRPVEGLTIRSSYGRSFRAPTFPDRVGSGGNLLIALPIPDPHSPTGQTVVLGEFGFADNVGPEKAKSWTVGADLNDWPVTGLRASISYFDIRYRDRIGSASADYLSFLTRRDLYGALVTDDPSQAVLAQLFADPRFSNPFGYQPTDVKALINGLIQNLSRQTVRGLDFDVEYRRSIGSGAASIGLSGTRLFAIERQVTADAPPANIVSVLGNPVKLRLRGRAGWEQGGFSAFAFVSRVGGYQNQTVTPTETVRPWTTVDGSIGYKFADATPLAGARLGLNVTNLFDRRPPYVAYHNFDQTLAFDPEQASPLGRNISVQFTMLW